MKRYIKSNQDDLELFKRIGKIVIVDNAFTYQNGVNSQTNIILSYSKAAIKNLDPEYVQRIFSTEALQRIYEIAPEKLTSFQCNYIEKQLEQKFGLSDNDKSKILKALKECNHIDESREGVATRNFLIRFGISTTEILNAVQSLKPSDLQYWTRDKRSDSGRMYNGDALVVAYPNYEFEDTLTGNQKSMLMYIKIDYTMTTADGTAIALVSFHENDTESYKKEQAKIKRNGPYPRKHIK